MAPEAMTLIQCLSHGHISGPDGLCKEKIPFLCHSQHLPGLFFIDGKGFLAQHMLSMLQTQLDVLIMVGMGCSDIHQLYLGILYHFFIRSISLFNAVLLCKCLCPVMIPGRYGIIFLPDPFHVSLPPSSLQFVRLPKFLFSFSIFSSFCLLCWILCTLIPYPSIPYILIPYPLEYFRALSVPYSLCSLCSRSNGPSVTTWMWR